MQRKASLLRGAAVIFAALVLGVLAYLVAVDRAADQAVLRGASWLCKASAGRNQPLGKTRAVYFPRQVGSADEIEVGATYLWCNLQYGYARPFVVVGAPYGRGKDASPAIDVAYADGYAGYLYLGDMSVVPYSNGDWFAWNNTNVLVLLFP